ncbi:MAG: right-handed parallel beta-helix repeat-containing protein, partial [Phycisphaeraceae bacterium]|nr:right-handed parallel beta-helix repeat-containing protein [Phycisphaeraceae bacterium]
MTTETGYCNPKTSTKTLVVNIKDFGAKGDNKHNDSPALRKAINKIKENHGGTIFFPKGTYVLYDQETTNHHIKIKNASNLKLLGAEGSQIIMKNPELGGFVFVYCTNITVSNLSIDYDPVPFTQGTIVKLNSENNSFEFLKDPGYPDPTDENYTKARKRGSLFNSDGTRNSDAGVIFIDKITPNGSSDGKKQFTLRRSKDFTRWQDDLLKNIKVGHKFMLMARYTGSHTFLFVNGTNILIEKTTVYSSPSMPFVGISCDGIKIQKCVVKIKPGTSRLISTDAEPVHLAACRNSYNIIEDCNSSQMSDDAINLNGRTLRVFEILDKKTIMVYQKIGGDFIKDSDTFELLDGKQNTIKGTAVLLKHTRVKNKTDAFFANKKIWKLEFDRPLDHIQINDHLADLDACSGNFVIRNNVFSYPMGMGIRLRSINGLVENNKIQYSNGAGIYIGAHLDPSEAPNGKNIIIKNNHIFHCGFGVFHSSIVNQGSIHLTSLNHKYNTVKGAYRNQNIKISNNTIEESARAGIYINDAIDVSVIGNKIINPNYLNNHRVY